MAWLTPLLRAVLAVSLVVQGAAGAAQGVAKLPVTTSGTAADSNTGSPGVGPCEEGMADGAGNPCPKANDCSGCCQPGADCGCACVQVPAAFSPVSVDASRSPGIAAMSPRMAGHAAPRLPHHIRPPIA